MADQIIDATMARSIHTETANKHVLAGWIILRDPPEHPGKFVARLVTTHPTIYVMLADTLAELQAMLPPGLERSPRQPADPGWLRCGFQSRENVSLYLNNSKNTGLLPEKPTRWRKGRSGALATDV